LQYVESKVKRVVGRVDIIRQGFHIHMVDDAKSARGHHHMVMLDGRTITIPPR